MKNKMTPKEAWENIRSKLFYVDTPSVKIIDNLVAKAEQSNEKLKKLIRIIDSQIKMYDDDNKVVVSGALWAIKQMIEVNLLDWSDEK